MARNVRNIKRADDNEPVSVQEVVQDYLASSHVKRLGVRTQEEYQQRLTTFANWCTSNNVMLHQVDSKRVDQFVEHIRTTHAPAKAGREALSTYTLAGYVRVITSFLHWCQDDQQFHIHLQAAVVQRIKKPKVIEAIVQPFTPEQVASLFDACAKEESEHLQMRDRAILALLLDCGIRANELVTLQIRNVSLDPKDAYVRVLGKGGKWGEVGLGEEARRYVQKYIRLYREPTIEHEAKERIKTVSLRQATQITAQIKQHALLIVNRSGKSLTTRGLWRTIERLGRYAQIEGVRCSPHTFRHTFAVLFWRRTHDIRTLSKLLRHSSIAVTENYLKSILQAEARIGAPSVLDEL
jgi:integrase/recombinase XerD